MARKPSAIMKTRVRSKAKKKAPAKPRKPIEKREVTS